MPEVIKGVKLGFNFWRYSMLLMHVCFCCVLLVLSVHVLANRLAGKSISEFTYFVSSCTLNLNSVWCQCW